jgi:hypothetical protein
VLPVHITHGRLLVHSGQEREREIEIISSLKRSSEVFTGLSFLTILSANEIMPAKHNLHTACRVKIADNTQVIDDKNCYQQPY